MEERMIVGIVVLTLIVGFLMLNRMYKNTNHYQNHYRYAYEYLKQVNRAMDAEIVNLGSTYAQFAFSQYSDFSIKGCNFALYSRPLRWDYVLLKKHIPKMKKCKTVLIVLNVCVCLCGKLCYDGSGNHFFALLPEFKGPDTVKRVLKFYLPLINLKNIKHLFHDTNWLGAEQVYQRQTACVQKTVEENMSERIHAWDEQLNLNHFILSDSHKEIIENNLHTIDEIVSLCAKNCMNPVIVVPPFSETLNKLIPEHFYREAFYDPIRTRFPELLFLDYSHDGKFSREDLYVDGGFLLNKEGSRLFIRNVLSDITDNGIELDGGNVDDHSENQR